MSRPLGALSGTRLGPYELLALLGAGGMGEVYRARDTRLDRDVAVKVIPQSVAPEAERLQRFEQEARALSALNHANILTVFDVGAQGDASYLVTELLEGQTLGELLKAEELPVTRALELAGQIANGLAAAHDKGIVHRDLKPDNVFVTSTGQVKILDFGLARLAHSGEPQEDPSEGRTETKLTRAGALLGTVGYMAPEQVRGLPADARSDIFAFGAVVYEIFSGRRAFARDTTAEIMTAILREEPVPLDELRPEVPRAVLRVLERCLAKRPEERYPSGRELLFALEVAAVADPTVRARPAPPLPPPARWGRALVWLASGVLGGALATSVVLSPRTGDDGASTRVPVVASLVLPREAGSLVTWAGTADIALSPDGSHVAYVGVGQDRRRALFLRDLDTEAVREIPGTSNALGPFWSPDSSSLAFFADDKLKRVRTDGGPIQLLCDVPDRGQGMSAGAWNRDDVVLFSDGRALSRVPATGGTPQLVLEPDGTDELFFRHPSFLPDGQRFLYHVRRAAGVSRIYLRSLVASVPAQLVDEGTSRAVLSPAGQLVSVRDGVLIARPLDERSLRSRGEPKPIAIRVANHASSGRAGFSVSESGRMAYVEGGEAVTELVWRDRGGRLLESVTEEGRYIGAVLAPDGRRIAVEIEDDETSQHGVWVLGPSRGVQARLTRPPGDGHHPAWSPDGRQIAYSSTRAGKQLVYRGRSDGLGDDSLVFDSPDATAFYARQWTPDGGGVLAAAVDRGGRMRLWLLPVASSGVARPLVDGFWGALSPSGRWLAVSSAETGRFEVYVLPFPGLDTRRQVSMNGGSWPRWRSNGLELYYVSDDRRLMSVAVAAGDAFEAAPPVALFPLPLRTGDRNPNYPHEYDVAASGDRFVVCQVPDRVASPSITLVTEWEELLRRR